ncbi:hypothetical protein HNQ51_003723 [Inhella inkyongensis]|uniref:Uncharacterized protein n=1 Tax=Inhella inkyongensis TaxID=392593 RepID=A0A840S4Y2_9BURK|nr:hypothetical protein [Inhella inkyongensis]MBB5206377.1 hypothetical protein [Inhella inkyongensis]
MKRPYVIVTPTWCVSSGVRVLHGLCHELRSLGLEAYVLLTNNLSQGGPVLNPAFHTPAINAQMDSLWPRLRREAITVYADGVPGNPFEAERVVRYVLGKEVLRGDENPAEFRLYHSKAFPVQRRGDQRTLYYLPVDLGLFNALNTAPTLEREQDLIWIGKGGRYVGAERPPGVREITYGWPPTREELAAELRKTRFLYSYDTLSATNLEAILCGAVVVLKTLNYHEWPWTRRDIEATEHGSGGYAFGDSEFEVQRALQTRPEFVANIRYHQQMFRQLLWEFVEASQAHFKA